jgi:hypothetical protein
MDSAHAEQQAGDECMRVADDYVAIGEHDVAMTFVRQAQVHYERAATLHAAQPVQGTGESASGTVEAA